MSIVLEKLTKRYDDHPVVNNVSLEIKDGEFFVLLGSSGSGKTTVLSMIAGLTAADQGRVLLHGRDVTWLPPQQRNVGFVFQNYALFQYMTVAQNVEFGLELRKVQGLQRRQKRDEQLELVGLAGLGNRMPSQLSGGQQQRVALARALAYEPDVLLLDEPLGALDAKIRVDLRRSLKLIQRKLGVATIFVTHDQEEAFDLADRIGVMSFGRLLETGTPEELYQHPQTEFVASFLGSANLLLGRLEQDQVRLGNLAFPAESSHEHLSRDDRVQILFRPEDVALAHQASELGCPQLEQAEVEEVSFAGAVEKLRLRLPPIPGVRPLAPLAAFGAESFVVDATRTPEQAMHHPLRLGDRTWVGIHRIHTLAHPGLSFLIVTDGGLRSRAAVSLGGQIGRLAHARVTLLGCENFSDRSDPHLEEARKELGSGLAEVEVLVSREPAAQAVAWAVERRPYDMVILGFGYPQDLELAEMCMAIGEHHLLLVPRPQPAPVHALICVTSGEPGKDDILFAGRLVRHLSAEASLLSVIPAETKDPERHQRVERFLESGVRSLSLLGVPAVPNIRVGEPAEEIRAEISQQPYDLVVLGAPLTGRDESVSLNGVVRQTLEGLYERSVLIVRSHDFHRQLQAGKNGNLS
ncbi:MAG: ATP-binding cassette domain-containing protein [Anaerolineales bacterium]|nr:ATP-binding cassette domain-containing protein [Anaerolineales bacterium]